MVYIIFY